MKTLILAASLVLGVAAIPAVASAQDYPPCGPGQTDKCTQTYEGHGWASGGEHRMMRHHGRHHAWRHHRHHHHRHPHRHH